MRNQLQYITNGFGVAPYDINNGSCSDWAEQVKNSLPDVQIWEIPFGLTDQSHIFVRIAGRFYDAECLDGVEDHMDLPIFVNNRVPGRLPAWLVDHNCIDPISENQRDMTPEMVHDATEFNS